MSITRYLGSFFSSNALCQKSGEWQSTTIALHDNEQTKVGPTEKGVCRDGGCTPKRDAY